MHLILLHVITILILIGAAIIFIIKATINALFKCQCAVHSYVLGIYRVTAFGYVPKQRYGFEN